MELETIDKSQALTSSRVFSDLMLKVGANGKYQANLLLLWSFMTVLISSTFFSNPFFFQIPPYSCPELEDDACNTFVCNLPLSERSQYISHEVDSLGTSFGDYHCGKNIKITAYESLIYLGGLFGVFLGSFLSQFLRKKQLMLLTFVVSTVFYVLTFFAPSLIVAVVGLFVNYAMRGIQMQLIYCFLTETLSEDESNKKVSFVLMFYGLGVALNGPVFWLFGSWQKVVGYYYIISNLIILTVVIFYLEETPMDCVVRCEPSKSQRIFERIASINGTSETHGITVEYIALLRIEYLENQKKKHDNHITMLDMLVYPSLRVNVVLVNLLSLVAQFTFDGPQLVLDDDKGFFSIYQNGFIIGAAEVLSCIASIFLIDKYKRRLLTVIPAAIGFLIALAISIVSDCTDECTTFQSIFETVGLFLFHLMIGLVFNVALIIALEVFPTQVRTLGVLMVAASGFIGTILIPEISDLLRRYNLPMEVSFCTSCALIIVLTIFLPETHNVPPPDMIEELKFQHSQI